MSYSVSERPNTVLEHPNLDYNILILSQAAAVSNEKLAGSIDGVGQCFSEKKLRF